jgi:hypothetical protein
MQHHVLLDDLTFKQTDTAANRRWTGSRGNGVMRTIFILQEAGFFIRLPDPQRESTVDDSRL